MPGARLKWQLIRRCSSLATMISHCGVTLLRSFVDERAPSSAAGWIAGFRLSHLFFLRARLHDVEGAGVVRDLLVVLIDEDHLRRIRSSGQRVQQTGDLHRGICLV